MQTDQLKVSSDLNSLILNNTKENGNANKLSGLPNQEKPAAGTSSENGPMKKQDIQRKDMSAWFKLFAELDPLANPDAMPGTNANQSHAA